MGQFKHSTRTSVLHLQLEVHAAMISERRIVDSAAHLEPGPSTDPDNKSQIVPCEGAMMAKKEAFFSPTTIHGRSDHVLFTLLGPGCSDPSVTFSSSHYPA